MKHVDHLLPAYVADQLNPHRAAQVRQHIRFCPACRDKLARHERIAADLRLALQQSPVPRETDIRRWWQTIDLRPAPPPRRPNLLPALLSLVLLITPFAATLNHAIYPAPTPDGTFVTPAIVTNLEPYREAGQIQTASITLASPVRLAATPVPSTPFPAIPPAPLAP